MLRGVTGTPPRSRRSSDDKRARILAAAVPLFARSGFASVTLRDIADASGFLIGSIYHFYPEKEQLYEEAVKLAFEQCSATLVAAVTPDGSAEERLHVFVGALFDQFTSDSPYIRLIDREHLGDGSGQVGKLVSTVFWQVHEALNPLIAELSRTGRRAVRPLDWRTSLVFSLVYGAAKLHGQHAALLDLRTRRARDRFVGEIAQFALNALRGYRTVTARRGAARVQGAARA